MYQTCVVNLKCKFTVHNYFKIPGEGPNTGQLCYVPNADQGVRTTGGKVLSLGVKLDTDTVSRVGIEGVLEF